MSDFIEPKKQEEAGLWLTINTGFLSSLAALVHRVGRLKGERYV